MSCNGTNSSDTMPEYLDLPALNEFIWELTRCRMPIAYLNSYFPYPRALSEEIHRPKVMYLDANAYLLWLEKNFHEC